MVILKNYRNNSFEWNQQSLAVNQEFAWINWLREENLTTQTEWK